MKRIKWTDEEAVAIVDLYFRVERGAVADLNAELMDLSETLNRRADILGIVHDDKFRNFNGMKCIYQNVRYLATDGEVGLRSSFIEPLPHCLDRQLNFISATAKSSRRY